MSIIAINMGVREIDGIQPQEHREITREQADRYAKLLPNEIKIIETDVVESPQEVETSEEVQTPEEVEASEEEEEEAFLDADNAQVVHGMTEDTVDEEADFTVDFTEDTTVGTDVELG